MAEQGEVKLLPEVTARHPVEAYAQHVLDRIRVVKYLWNYQNDNDWLSKQDGVIDLEGDRETIATAVKREFEKEDSFYTEVDYHDRPKWENGVPSHTKAVPLNTNEEVIREGVEWFCKLRPAFNRTMEMLDNEWAADSKVFRALDLLEERLLELSVEGKKEYPDNWLEPEVLIDYILGEERDVRFTIDQEDTTLVNAGPEKDKYKEIQEIGQDSVNKTRLVRPVIRGAIKDLLIGELARAE